MVSLTTIGIAVVLCFLIFRFINTKTKTQLAVPGLSPRSHTSGNFEDIVSTGSLHQFLQGLHRQFGDIASFWLGPTQVVSICDATLFKDQIHSFDRPPVLFELFKPLIGAKSIQYANGEEGRARRILYDRCLTHGAVRKYFPIFQQLSNKTIQALDTYQDSEHIAISKHLLEFTLESDLVALFGEHLDQSIISKFGTLYDLTWNEMELRLMKPPTPSREKSFAKARGELYDLVKHMVRSRKSLPTEHGEEFLLDLIMDLTSDEEQQLSDTLTFIIGGFHTSGHLLTWAFYYLASNLDVQERVYREIQEIMGDDDIDFTNIAELRYLRQVQDETMRCCVLGPYAARFQDEDSQIGGYVIPKETPVIHAIGVASLNENVWSDPDKFDPDRFSPENVAKRPHLAFVPFGFAGKRVCPGQRFAYAEVSVFMVSLLRKFKVNLVPGHAQITRVHGLVTHPSDEIWVTLSKRYM